MFSSHPFPPLQCIAGSSTLRCMYGCAVVSLFSHPSLELPYNSASSLGHRLWKRNKGFTIIICVGGGDVSYPRPGVDMRKGRSVHTRSPVRT